jgi:uncharacterized protein (DUF1697 family)
MALVAFLKGVNVGGRRRFRPTVLAEELKRYDVTNVGAAGTFVFRRRISRANLRAEVRRRVPFDVEVMICTGSEILRLLSADPFEGHTIGRDIVPFVSVMAKRRTLPSALPPSIPADGDWCLKVLTWQGRFVVGLHRRQMKAITYLAQLEKLLGVSLTTRTWTTIRRIGRVLGG